MSSDSYTTSSTKSLGDLSRLLSIIPSHTLTQRIDKALQQGFLTTLEQPVAAESFLLLSEQEKAFVLGAGVITLETLKQLWHTLDMRQRGFILSTYDTVTPAFIDEVELDEGMMKLLCATRRDLVRQTKQRLRVLLTEYSDVPEIGIDQIQAAR